MEATKVENDEFPIESDKALATLEKELDKSGRKRPTHPNGDEVHPLTRKEESLHRRHHPNYKGKKYDGRAHSKNAVVARVAVREALESFYKEVQLPDLKQALQLNNDPRYTMLLAALNNPRFSSFSFSELCRRCKMSIQDVVEVWRNHLKTQGLVRMMGHMPDIMEDVAVDSKSKMVTCDKCQGKGKLEGQVVNNLKDPICPECHGDGTVRIQGDKDARLLAFETVGLRKSGAVVTNVNMMNFNKGVPSMEDQISSLDKVFDVDAMEVEDEQHTDDGPTGDAAGPQRSEEAHRVAGDTAADDKPDDPTNYSS
jgi:hypothetical protein